MNSPEVRSVVYGWITLLLTSAIGGVGWWIKRVSVNRATAVKAASDPARDEIFTKQMQMLLDDCRHEMAIRDARIDKRDTEIAALRAEIERLRQASPQHRRRTDGEGPG